jgi:hypothetical protein
MAFQGSSLFRPITVTASDIEDSGTSGASGASEIGESAAGRAN